MKRQESKEELELRKRLIALREAAGLTQMQVEKSGIVSQSQLSKLENGDLRLSFLLALKLVRFYKADLSDLISNQTSR